MSRLTIPALAVCLCGAGALSTVSAAPPTFAALVNACRSEASQALEQAWRSEPQLRDAIAAHRELMSTACVRWQSAEKTDVLLAQCLDQAEEGQHLAGRSRDVDPAYAERQKEFCRQLAAQRS